MCSFKKNILLWSCVLTETPRKRLFGVSVCGSPNLVGSSESSFLLNVLRPSQCREDHTAESKQKREGPSAAVNPGRSWEGWPSCPLLAEIPAPERCRVHARCRCPEGRWAHSPPRCSAYCLRCQWGARSYQQAEPLPSAVGAKFTRVKLPVHGGVLLRLEK